MVEDDVIRRVGEMFDSKDARERRIGWLVQLASGFNADRYRYWEQNVDDAFNQLAAIESRVDKEESGG